MRTLQGSWMSKPLYITYGAYDKIEFEDFGSFAEIRVCETPGILKKTKIKKMSKGYLVFDIKSDFLSYVDKKALFRRDISFAVENYGKMFGLSFSDKDIVISGTVGDDNISRFSEIFRMVWIKDSYDSDEFLNVYRVSGKLPAGDVGVWGGGDCPASEILFNLTDKEGIGICNFSVISDNLSRADGAVAAEIIRICRLPYKIIEFGN